MIDTHCHLTFDQFAGRVEDVIVRAREAGLRGLITVSVTSANCGESLALAERHEDVWCTAGVHPLYAGEPRDWDDVRTAARHPRCVAWGELGLDNHYEDPPRSLQDEVLAEQLDLIEREAAEGRSMPVILHCREAFDDLLSVLRGTRLDPARFVFHCFTGGPVEARKVLDFGAWISFTGVVTFRSAREVAEAARLVPADRVMVETDAPFLTPAPHRKVWPNEPRYVVHTARRLAELRGVDAGVLERQLDANAERFFGIALAATRRG